MEPENDKPDADELKVGDASVDARTTGPKTAKEEGVEAKVVEVVQEKNVESKAVEPEMVQAKIVETETVETKTVSTEIAHPRMNERRFAQVSRRELLKVAPVLALGAFAIPRFQESLLKKGLGFSDWASARLFRRGSYGSDVCGCGVDAVREVSHQRVRR